MYIRYNDKVGRLLFYKVVDNGKVEITIELTDGTNFEFTCKEKQVSIPCVMGNSKILYEILKDTEVKE